MDGKTIGLVAGAGALVWWLSTKDAAQSVSVGVPNGDKGYGNGVMIPVEEQEVVKDTAKGYYPQAVKSVDIVDDVRGAGYADLRWVLQVGANRNPEYQKQGLRLSISDWNVYAKGHGPQVRGDGLVSLDEWVQLAITQGKG